MTHFSTRFRTTFRRAAVVLTTGAATLAATLSGGTPATAAGSWTVTPGGAFGTSFVAGQVGDTTTGTMLSCRTGALGGALGSGSGLPGTSIATITTWQLGPCTGPLAIPKTFTAVALPWHLTATGYDPATGTTTGTLTGVSLHMGGSGGVADFDGPGGAGSGTGRLDVSYANGSNRLTLSGGNLRVYNLAGFYAGLINNGDPWLVDGSFTLNPGTTVTSP